MATKKASALDRIMAAYGAIRPQVGTGRYSEFNEAIVAVLAYMANANQDLSTLLDIATEKASALMIHESDNG